jgi:hypothetical protein
VVLVAVGGIGGEAPDVNDGEAGGLLCAEGAAAGCAGEAVPGAGAVAPHGEYRGGKREVIAVSERILVTSALPYANGSIHLGHLVEYIQTDVYVRFACGDDITLRHAPPTRTARIEVNAARPGWFRAFTEKYRREHADSPFFVEFSTFYTTDSPENERGRPSTRRSRRRAHLQAVRGAALLREDQRFLPIIS